MLVVDGFWRNGMALKDTLERRQKELASAQSFDKAAIIAEWQQAVRALMSKIEEFLHEYKTEGTLQFEHGDMELTEEALGNYQIPQMTLRAGSAVLMIQPIGRLIIGATGRVDLYRQGRAAKDDRVMALRSAPNDDSQWMLSIPPEDSSFRIMPTNQLGQSLKRTIVPLTKESLEAALDRLLQ
jgi:hypothetical protein